MASASEHQPEPQAAHLAGERATADADARVRSSHLGRRSSRRVMPLWLTILLIVLTCVGVLASALTVWAEATLLNTDRFVALVGPVGRDSQTIHSVSQYVADQVVTALDIPQRTASALPTAGQFLTGPLEQTIHDFVRTRTEDYLNSNQGQALWLALERSIHANLVAALRGQTSTITIANGTLSLDTLPLLVAVLSRLQQSTPGLIPSGVTIPDLSDAQSPQQEREALSQALGVRLASDFGVVTLVHSNALLTARRIVSVLDMLTIILPMVTLALALITLWFAANRRRALLLLGIVTGTLALATILVVQTVLSDVPGAAPTSTGVAREITATLVAVVRSDLLGMLVVLLFVSALVALGAYLAGMPRWLTRLVPATREG